MKGEARKRKCWLHRWRVISEGWEADPLLPVGLDQSYYVRRVCEKCGATDKLCHGSRCAKARKLQ